MAIIVLKQNQTQTSTSGRNNLCKLERKTALSWLLSLYTDKSSPEEGVAL